MVIRVRSGAVPGSGLWLCRAYAGDLAFCSISS